MRETIQIRDRSRRQARAVAGQPVGPWQRPDGAAFERLQFLGAFLRNPAGVGALMPSSPALARELVDSCDLGAARVVVELGPGTGAVTEVLLQHLGKRSRFFALELDRNNTFLLRKRFPGCEIHNDSAENLRHHVNRCGPGGVDSVVSGLPWGNMGAGLQERILQAVVDVLAPGGRFATFAYIHTRWLPSARRFRRMLEDRFATVEQSRVVWRNLPPAVVYRCVQGGSPSA